jgi:membrane protein
MARKRSKLATLIVEPFQEWSRDNASTLAAALAYYTVMSLVPLLIIIVIIASYFIKTNTAIDQLTSQISQFTSQEVANFVKTLLAGSKNPVNGSLSSIISVATLILGASGLFSQLQSSLNRIWNVPPDQRGGFRKTVKNHAVSFFMVLGIGILFLVFLAVEAFVSLLIGTIPAGSQNHLIAVIANYVVLFILVTILIALIFRIVPDKEISWGDVLLGAAVTAVLFIIGRFAIGLFLSFNKTASGYGAAGSLIVLLIWIYYSAQIFFFGAEFTQVYARTVGTHKDLPEEPKPDLREEKPQVESVSPEKLPEEEQPVVQVENSPSDKNLKDEG